MADVTTKIFLEEFEVMVDIGIHDFEINNPQRVCISVEVLLDPNAVDRSDEIGSTFDYDFIRLEIKNLTSNRRFNLQETLCRLILDNSSKDLSAKPGLDPPTRIWSNFF